MKASSSISISSNSFGTESFQLLAEALELVGLIAAAHAEHEPAVRQRVDHADLGDQAHGLVERRHHHRGAELDALGLAREPRQHHQRRGAHAVVGEVVLGEPGDLEAVGLGRLHLLDRVVVELVRLGARRAVAHQVELAEVHRAVLQIMRLIGLQFTRDERCLA